MKLHRLIPLLLLIVVTNLPVSRVFGDIFPEYQFMNAAELPAPECISDEAVDGKCRSYLLRTPSEGNYSFHTYLQAGYRHLGEQKVAWFMRRIERLYMMTEKFLANYYTTNHSNDLPSQRQLSQAYFSEVTNLLDDTYQADKKNYLHGFVYGLVSVLANPWGDKVYPDISKKGQLARVHAIYAAVNRWHVQKVPPLSDLTNTRGMRFMHIQGRDGYGLSLPLYRTKGDVQRLVAALIFITIHGGVIGSGSPWSSLESTQWIVDRVPELKKSQVIELGSGTGLRAGTLAGLGVDVIATDKKPADMLPLYPVDIEALDAIAALEKYPERNVFWVEFAGWNIFSSPQGFSESTLNMMSNRGVWTLIYVTSSNLLQLFPLHVESQFHVEKLVLPDKNSGLSEAVEGAEISIYVLRDKPSGYKRDAAKASKTEL